MTRLIGNAFRRLGSRLVCLGMYCTAIGCHLAPRKRAVVPWSEPAAWTEAHEQPRITSRGPADWN